MKTPDSAINEILVVEDETSISDICQRVLIGEGFEVDIAVNGKVAQEMIGKKSYALCLIDIRTPIMGGNELYVWLLQEHPQMARRVIFTTGDVLGGETTGFIEQSGRPFLSKPFTPDELKAIVRKTLEEIEQ